MDFKKCSRCGASNAITVNFCGNCGMALPIVEEAQSIPVQTVTPSVDPTFQQAAPSIPYPAQPYGMEDSNQPTPPPYVVPYRPKSRIAAGIMAILIGTFGVHNFYLGYTKKAVAQLLLTLLSGFILSVVPFIWGIVEGVMLLCGKIDLDGHNVPLAD